MASIRDRIVHFLWRHSPRWLSDGFEFGGFDFESLLSAEGLAQRREEFRLISDSTLTVLCENIQIEMAAASRSMFEDVFNSRAKIGETIEVRRPASFNAYYDASAVRIEE